MSEYSCQTPISEIAQRARDDYERVSMAACDWNSVIPQAIDCWERTQGIESHITTAIERARQSYAVLTEMRSPSVGLSEYASQHLEVGIENVRLAIEQFTEALAKIKGE